MKYLIGAILFGVAGVVLGISDYLAGGNNSTAYTMGVAASITYLISFVFLEYSLYSGDFGSMFTAWGGGIAILVVLISIFLWGEPLNTAGMVFTAIAGIGLIGLLLSSRY